MREERAEGHEFGVPGTVASYVGCVHSLGDDLVIIHENRSNGGLADRECISGLY